MLNEHEPEPQAEPALKKTAPLGTPVSLITAGLAVAGILALLATAGFLGSQAQGPPPAASKDHVTQEMRASIDAGFMHYTGDPQMADLTDEATRQEFLAISYLPEEEKQQVLEAAENNERRIGIVFLWDNQDEDGDVVRIQTSEGTIDVPILHTPLKVFIPMKPGEPLHIMGLHDGGGGITAAVETRAGAVPLPIMSVGQTISLPVL